MMPAIRNGLVSTLDLFANWWRARGAAAPLPPAGIAPVEDTASRPRSSRQPRIAVHAEEALRAFISFALDEGACVVRPPDASTLQPLLNAGNAALARLEVQARYLPRRPSLLPKLLSAMNNDGKSMGELARIIGGDPTLLGNLLRVANSVYYRVNDQKIESLDRAVTRVGLDGIRAVIATSLVHPVMARGQGWHARFPETVWEQTQLAADAAELHATRIERIDGFNARLLALVHGLATNTVFRILRDEVLSGHDEASKPAVARLLEQWAVPIATRIAASWDLPADVQRALAAAREDNYLARSLFFGRLAGSLLIMVQRGRMKEFSARAFALASDSRRSQIDGLWTRLATANLGLVPPR
jgi:HD-like signal output (HDOD) protein